MVSDSELREEVLQKFSTERLIGELERRGIRLALWKSDFEPDLSKCPNCGGPADNGHDREVPPNPYICKKCSR